MEENTNLFEKKPRKNSFSNSLFSFIKDLTIIIIIVFIIKTFLMVPFVINGQSMYDSYYDKEFIIVDKVSYILGEPKRGDVIVFKPGVDKSKEYFLKRVIGIPEDTLKITDGKVYIKPKGKKDFIELKETYLSKNNLGSTFVGTNKNLEKIYTIEKGKYFAIGDNRKHSTDSRECFSNCIKRSEFITKEDMVGKVFFDLGYFDITKLKFIHPNLGIKTFPRFFSSPSTFKYKELE